MHTNSHQITLGNGHTLPIHHSSKGILPTPSGKLNLENLYHVPNLSFNLISINRLTSDNKCTVTFTSNGFKIQDSMTDKLLLQGPCFNGLYLIRSSHSASKLALISTKDIPNLWHRRLGHPASTTQRKLTNTISTICFQSPYHHCNACNMAKSHRLPFSNFTKLASTSFELAHSDVWGPSPVTSMQGYKYYLSFIDDYSRFC